MGSRSANNCLRTVAPRMQPQTRCRVPRRVNSLRPLRAPVSHRMYRCRRRRRWWTIGVPVDRPAWLLDRGRHRGNAGDLAAQGLDVRLVEELVFRASPPSGPRSWPGINISILAPRLRILSVTLLRGAVAQRDHDDHRGHADDDSQHGQSTTASHCAGWPPSPAKSHSRP